MKTSTYYSETTYWSKYNDFLPEELQFKNSKLPTEEYWKWKEFDIHLDRMKNPKSPLKIIILHGAGGNGRVVGLLGNFIHSLGYEYVAPDLIGYGLTKNPKKLNIDYSAWVDSISDFIDEEILMDSRPIVLFGLSMGGMLAYQVAAKNTNVNGLIVTTLADPRSKKVKDDLSKNKFLSRVAMPFNDFFKLITDHVKLPIKWLCKMDKITNDVNFSKVFSNDKLAGGSMVKLRFLRTYMSFKPKIEPENFNKCPVLFLQPERDTWTTIETSKPFYDRLNCDKRLVELENCGHAPYEEPGLTTMKKEVLHYLAEIN